MIFLLFHSLYAFERNMMFNDQVVESQNSPWQRRKGKPKEKRKNKLVLHTSYSQHLEDNFYLLRGHS